MKNFQLILILVCMFCAKAYAGDSTKQVTFIPTVWNERHDLELIYSPDYAPARKFMGAFTTPNPSPIVGASIKHKALMLTYLRMLPTTYDDLNSAVVSGFDLRGALSFPMITRADLFETNLTFEGGYGKVKIVSNELSERFHLTGGLMLEQRFFFRPKEASWGVSYGVRGGYIYNIYDFEWQQSENETLEPLDAQFRGLIVNLFLGISLYPPK